MAATVLPRFLLFIFVFTFTWTKPQTFRVKSPKTKWTGKKTIFVKKAMTAKTFWNIWPKFGSLYLLRKTTNCEELSFIANFQLNGLKGHQPTNWSTKIYESLNLIELQLIVASLLLYLILPACTACTVCHQLATPITHNNIDKLTIRIDNYYIRDWRLASRMCLYRNWLVCSSPYSVLVCMHCVVVIFNIRLLSVIYK